MMCSCRSCLAHVDFVWFVQISVNSIRTHVFKSALVDEIFRYAKFIPELFQRNSREMSARDADFDSKYVVTCGQRFVPAQFRDLSPHAIFTPFTFPRSKYLPTRRVLCRFRDAHSYSGHKIPA